jgi:hypothetical protein
LAVDFGEAWAKAHYQSSWATQLVWGQVKRVRKLGNPSSPKFFFDVYYASDKKVVRNIKGKSIRQFSIIEPKEFLHPPFDYEMRASSSSMRLSHNLNEDYLLGEEMEVAISSQINEAVSMNETIDMEQEGLFFISILILFFLGR